MTPMTGNSRPAPRRRGVVARLEDIFAVAAGFFVVVMMLTITADAAGRYFLGSPVTGAVEFTERYLMVAVVWLAASATQRQGKHISVDVAYRLLPQPVRRFLTVATHLLGAGVFSVVTYGSILRGVERFDALTTGAVQMRTGPAWFLLGIGAGLLALRLLILSLAPLSAEWEDEVTVAQQPGLTPAEDRGPVAGHNEDGTGIV